MNLPHIPQDGDIVDKYSLVRVLGKGGFGIVFEAKNAHLPGKRVAIKFLLERQLNNREERERFNRETHIGTLLESGRNVDVIDAGEFVKQPNASGIPYIVMEYLEGKDLDAHVDTYGPLLIQNAVDYILQACIALAEAHSRGIFHRDIKPANLFLTSHLGAPFIKVLDFGLAKTNTGPSGVPATTTGLIMLSVGYAPPEQQKGLKLADALSDIFSLGASLYFLLTGSRPFAGYDIHDIMVAVARDAPIPMGRFRQDVPPALIGVIERALEKEPEARPQSVVEFARLLVPFGSAEAMRLYTDVERAAALGTHGVAEVQRGGGTIKIPNVPSVSSIEPTIQRQPAQPAPVAPSPAMPTPPPAPPTVRVIPQPAPIQQHVPRQTNRLLVVLGLVALTVPLIGIAFWMIQRSTGQTISSAVPLVSEMAIANSSAAIDDTAPAVSTSSSTAVPIVSSSSPPTKPISGSAPKPPAKQSPEPAPTPSTSRDRKAKF